MAEKLVFDDGKIELDVNGRGVMRFNPSDFNVYQRFMQLYKDLPGIQKEYRAVENQSEDADGMALTGALLEQTKNIDQRIKGRLAEVFGADNDFDLLLDGVNVLAQGKNGNSVIENFLAALLPYMESGIRRYRKDTARKAVEQAKMARAKRV